MRSQEMPAEPMNGASIRSMAVVFANVQAHHDVVRGTLRMKGHLIMHDTCAHVRSYIICT